MAVSKTRFTAKSIFNRKVRVSSYMYNMLVILLYMYIHMCQSRCIKYDVHVNTVVCLLKCSSVHFWSDTSHTRSFGFITGIKIIFCCAYLWSTFYIKRVKHKSLFKIIVAKSSLHFLSQLVCHGLITVLVLFMNQ